jgi:hypothetical protein
MLDAARPVARSLIHKWPVGKGRSRYPASARDVRRTVLYSRAIARPVMDPGPIDVPSTSDDSAAVVCQGSLDWSLDRIRHQGVVVHGSPIGCPLDRSLHHIGHDRIIAILS